MNPGFFFRIATDEHRPTGPGLGLRKQAKPACDPGMWNRLRVVTVEERSTPTTFQRLVLSTCRTKPEAQQSPNAPVTAEEPVHRGPWVDLWDRIRKPVWIWGETDDDGEVFTANTLQLIAEARRWVGSDPAVTVVSRRMPRMGVTNAFLDGADAVVILEAYQALRGG